MKNKRFSINKLFYNNKIVLVFSIIIAFGLWIKISTGSSESVTKQISGIPITINLSDSATENGLTVFGIEDVTAEVSVSGNRIILGQLTQDNIQIFAQQSAGLINTTGNYTLELAARKKGVLTDFEFASNVSPNFINVFVDRASSKTIDITPEINYHADPTYFSSPITLSDSKVTISGPDSVVSSIAKATVEGEIKGTITETTTLANLPILLFDDTGKKITTTNLTFSTTKVDATVPVLSKKALEVSPTFSNQPTEMVFKNNKFKATPSSIEIASSKEILNTLNKIETESLDFSKINLEHSEFNLSLKVPNGCRILNNIYFSNIKLNMNGIQSKKINVDKITFINLAESKHAEASTADFKVEIVGPANEIKSLKSSDIYAQIDLSGKESFTGNTELPAKIIIESAPGCWAYGSHKINAQIK
ncbi:MAG: hypothetical protein RUMPE_00346 [Eubacteriales bacterium SKADARSKE-1]|nr:hypothetical protein [Eubacteriales bacterium SKADARSKE-1]